jgi:hypothetical protein
MQKNVQNQAYQQQQVVD